MRKINKMSFNPIDMGQLEDKLKSFKNAHYTQRKGSEMMEIDYNSEEMKDFLDSPVIKIKKKGNQNFE